MGTKRAKYDYYNGILQQSTTTTKGTKAQTIVGFQPHRYIVVVAVDSDLSESALCTFPIEKIDPLSLNYCIYVV